MESMEYRGLNGSTGWHYGVPLTNKLGTYIITEANPHICTEYHYIEVCEFEVVKPETVTPYIGRKDKNGKKIYAGDIVSLNHRSFCDGCVEGEVYFNDVTMRFDLQNLTGSDFYYETKMPFYSFIQLELVEIIGNKFERKDKR